MTWHEFRSRYIGGFKEGPQEAVGRLEAPRHAEVQWCGAAGQHRLDYEGGGDAGEEPAAVRLLLGLLHDRIPRGRLADRQRQARIYLGAAACGLLEEGGQHGLRRRSHGQRLQVLGGARRRSARWASPRAPSPASRTWRRTTSRRSWRP